MKIFSIILPAYNEELAIEETIVNALRASTEIVKQTPIDEVEIIVVNDGSLDKTERIVKRFDNVSLISHPKNYGYGAALKTGFKNARGDLLGFHDADGTCDSGKFTEFINVYFEKHADMIIGSRLGENTKMPRVRQIGNRFFAKLLSFLSGRKIVDAASGMRVFSKETIIKLYPLPDGLNFITALTTQALFQDMKIIEIEMPYNERKGESKLNVVKDGFTFLKAIFNVVSIYNPLKLFSAVGTFCFLFALCIGISIITRYMSTELAFEGQRYIYRTLAVMFFSSAGLMFVINGIVINMFIEKQRGLIARGNRMDKLIYHPLFYKRFLSIGIVLISCAVLLIAPGLIQYLRYGVVGQLWIFFALSALLGLIGIQLINSHFMMNIFHQYFEKIDFAKDAKRDSGAP